MKHSCNELMKLLNEYTRDPYNHESCSYGQSDGQDDINKECECNLYNQVEQFLLWVKDYDLRRIK